MEKLDRFLLAPLAALLFMLSRICFTLVFGALHAPGGFDPGRKEIEN